MYDRMTCPNNASLLRRGEELAMLLYRLHIVEQCSIFGRVRVCSNGVYNSICTNYQTVDWWIVNQFCDWNRMLSM